MRRTLDAFLTFIADLALRAAFRGIEIEGRDRIPKDRPTLVVANHFNGFVDPVIMVKVFRRLPRFLAKATLWNVKVARPLLKLAGLIPVYRPEDRDGVGGNESTFADCHEVLRENGFVAIFPEGTTHDDPYLAKVRTGAARIALGAKAEGVEGLVIVPIGLAFEDKLALRGRVFTEVGRPIELDDQIDEFVHEGEDLAEENVDAVHRLTDTIADRLREVSPDFADNRERRTFEMAGAIAARTELASYWNEPSFAETAHQARALAAAPAQEQAVVREKVATYNLDLTLAGISDEELVPGYTRGRLWRDLLLYAVIIAVLLPLVAIGIVVNIIPFWITRRASARPEAPVSKGTTRLLVGIGAFLITWLVVAFFVGQAVRGDNVEGVLEGLALIVLFAVSGMLAVHFFEVAIKLFDGFRGFSNLKNRRYFIDRLLDERQALLDAMSHAEATPAKAPDRIS